MASVWLGLGEKKTTPFVVGIRLGFRAKIEQTPFVFGLWLSLGKKKRDNTLCGRPFVKFRVKIERDTLVTDVWLGLGGKRRQQPLWLAFV